MFTLIISRHRKCNSIPFVWLFRISQHSSDVPFHLTVFEFQLPSPEFKIKKMQLRELSIKEKAISMTYPHSCLIQHFLPSIVKLPLMLMADEPLFSKGYCFFSSFVNTFKATHNEPWNWWCSEIMCCLPNALWNCTAASWQRSWAVLYSSKAS